jgi:hypothetical protein
MDVLREPDPFTFGRAFHAFLASYISTRDPQHAIDVADNTSAGINKGDFLRGMARGYVRYFTPMNDPFMQHDHAEVEQVFQTGLINPASNHQSVTFTLAGKADYICHPYRDDQFVNLATDNVLLVADHKTTSTFRDDQRTQLFESIQATLYAIAIAQLTYPDHPDLLNIEPRLAIVVAYNFIQKPTVSQRKTESEQDFQDRLTRIYAGKEENSKGELYSPYRRLFKVVQPSDVLRVRRLAWRVSQQILQDYRLANLGHRRSEDILHAAEMLDTMHTRGAFPQVTRSCHPIGMSPCPYLDLCLSENKTIIFHGLYRWLEAHQELMEEA